jgi:DNA-binding IclR family transcriptional regulator
MASKTQDTQVLAAIANDAETVNRIAQRTGLKPAQVRASAKRLVAAGAITARLDRRYDAQAQYTNYGVEGASCVRRFYVFSINTQEVK